MASSTIKKPWETQFPGFFSVQYFTQGSGGTAHFNLSNNGCGILFIYQAGAAGTIYAVSSISDNCTFTKLCGPDRSFNSSNPSDVTITVGQWGNIVLLSTRNGWQLI